jgi:hypothetical protein
MQRDPRLCKCGATQAVSQCRVACSNGQRFRACYGAAVDPLDAPPITSSRTTGLCGTPSAGAHGVLIRPWRHTRLSVLTASVRCCTNTPVICLSRLYGRRVVANGVLLLICWIAGVPPKHGQTLPESPRCAGLVSRTLHGVLRPSPSALEDCPVRFRPVRFLGGCSSPSHDVLGSSAVHR